jgi:hypothetical protein
MGAAIFGGCATPKSGKENAYFAVTASQAQIYRFGPSQPTGADALLKKGERVFMLRQEFGYSRVMTEEGITGYVANDLIGPTTPPPERPRTSPGSLAWANLPPLPSRGGGIPGVSSANRAIIQSAPLFGGEDLPPLPDATDGTPKPAFRTPKPRPGFRINVHAPSAQPPENKEGTAKPQ